MTLKIPALLGLFLSAVLLHNPAFAAVTPQEAFNIKFVQTLFKDLFEDPNANIKKLISERVSEDYVQYVDGKTLGYKEFIQHRLAQKEVISDIKVRFEHIIAEGDKVSTIHWVTAKKKNGEDVCAKVVALFQIKGNKLVMIDELTHLIKGAKEDADLGSRV